jgi:hypothetical protein
MVCSYSLGVPLIELTHYAVTQGGDWGFFVSNEFLSGDCNIRRLTKLRLRVESLLPMVQSTAKPGTPISLCMSPLSLYILPLCFCSSDSGNPPSLSRPLRLISHLLAILKIPGFAYSARDKDGLERTKRYFKTGNSYFVIQSSQPQTLGYSFADSPVGLLAWWYDKLVKGVDDTFVWTDDEGAFSRTNKYFAEKIS